MGKYFVFNISAITAAQIIEKIAEREAILHSNSRCIGCTGASNRTIGVVKHRDVIYAVLSANLAESTHFWADLNLPLELNTTEVEIEAANLEQGTTLWVDDWCRGHFDSSADGVPRPTAEELIDELGLQDSLWALEVDKYEAELALKAASEGRHWSDGARMAAECVMARNRTDGLGTRLTAAIAAAEAVVAAEKAATLKSTGQYGCCQMTVDEIFGYCHPQKPAAKKPAAKKPSHKEA